MLTVLDHPAQDVFEPNEKHCCTKDIMNCDKQSLLVDRFLPIDVDTTAFPSFQYGNHSPMEME